MQQQAYTAWVNQLQAQQKQVQEEAERKQKELMRQREEEEKKAKIQAYFSYQTAGERKSLKSRGPPLNIPLVNRAVLEEKMKEILKKHNVRMTAESVEIMELALTMRMKEIIEKLVKISACREETYKKIQHFEISSNPINLIHELQENEKIEDDQVQEMNKEAEKNRVEMDLTKNDTAVKASKLNFDKKEAQGVFAAQQTKKQTVQMPSADISFDSNQMFLIKEKYLYYCENRQNLNEAQGKEYVAIHDFLKAASKKAEVQLEQQQQQQQQQSSQQSSQPKPQAGTTFLPTGRSTSSNTATILGTQVEKPTLNPPDYRVFEKEMIIDKRDFMLFASGDPHLRSKLFYKKTALGIKVAPTVEYREQPSRYNHMEIL